MGIFDFFRAAPAKAPPRAELTTDVAVDYFDEIRTGRLFGLPEADEVLRKAGLTRAELRKVAADDEVDAAVETRLTTLLSVPWRLDPWQGDPVASELWDMVAPHMDTIITGAFSARLYGYSIMEAVYERSGDRIRISRIQEKPFEWFEPQRDGTLLFRPFGGRPRLVDTSYKFFLSRYRPTYHNPRGQALLSTLYWPWLMRSQGWRFWAKFLERFGSPFTVGKTNGDTSDMAAALVTLVQGGVAAVGQDDSIEVHTPGAAGESFDKFDTAIAKRIQKVVLGQTLTSDVQGGGSFAAAKVQNEVRGDRTTADIRLVTATVQAVINALAALNFPGAEVPQFILEDGEGLALERAERDGKLVQSGVLKLTEQYLLDKYDFEEGDFTIPAEQPPPDMTPGDDPMDPTEDAEQFAAGRFTADQQALEVLGAGAARQAASPIPPEKIREAIDAATSPDDLMTRLGDLFAAYRPEDAEELIARALFAADVMGYSSAQDSAEG